MGSLQSAVMTLGNVKAFRGHAVSDFVVTVADEEFVNHLNNTYGPAVVCNTSFAPGEVLKQVEPRLFGCMLADYQDEVQALLMCQLIQGNDVDIEFHD